MKKYYLKAEGRYTDIVHSFVGERTERTRRTIGTNSWWAFLPHVFCLRGQISSIADEHMNEILSSEWGERWFTAHCPAGSLILVFWNTTP